MVCVHSEKKHAIYYVIQGSRYANRTNVSIIAVRSKGTRHDCAEKGTRGLSKLSIVSFHSRIVSDGSCNSQESPGESEGFLSSSVSGRAEEREILGWMLRI
ncbi:hypothetical protein ALC57_05816 [Trachymyrmex cornetzi]|uniref:Uncharacterized protein n=1 Tax=Trachymyrmex cornetzi TaxID=471704 RepID=A0A151JA56_9HYME|nr:hypothetical protein ALC57_05816 [Trachymyrmex cornetzi]